MSKLSEPDDVEFFVGDVKPDENASIETAKFIEAYKKRPEFPFEVAEARQTLAALDIGARGDGMQNVRSLLAHWHRCVAELIEADLGESNRKTAGQENVGVASDVPRETQS